MFSGRQKQVVNWGDSKFEQVLKYEKSTWRTAFALPRFREDSDGLDYLWSYLRLRLCLRKQDMQLTLVLPLNLKSFRGQKLRDEKLLVFEPLESLFEPEAVLEEIESVKSTCCKCKLERKTYNPLYFQYRNARCRTIWYCEDCAELEDSDCDDNGRIYDWLCDDCRTIPKKERHVPHPESRCPSLEYGAPTIVGDAER